MDPLIARKTWRTAEPIHGAVYFAEEAVAEYEALGLDARQGYFASRAAAMGPVPAGAVIATFYNFSPAAVQRAIPSAWSIATPDAVLAARLRAADGYLRRVLGDTVGTADVEEAATLARVAAEAAAQRLEGRPLFAAHADLPWPDAAHLVLWHAQTLLREFRGDAHVAVLAAEGIGGCEALVIHAATGEVPVAALKSTRERSDDEWAEACTRLRDRGWIDGDGGLTEAGRVHRLHVEDRTDALALPAYAAIGAEGCDRLRALTRPLSKAIVAAGVFGFPTND